MIHPLRLACFTVAGWLVSMAVMPRLRARVLRFFGARVGRGVRIHRCLLMNHHEGFHHLIVGDDVFIGDNVTLDLAGPLRLGDRTTVSVGAILLTHADAGQSHGNRLVTTFPPTKRGLAIGADCWIGAGAIVLDGCTLGERAVVGAGAVVTASLPGGAVYVGNPARCLRSI